MSEPTAGKGRPTPKRREAQRQRRAPVVAPKTRREAAKLARERTRESRTTMRSALRTGDERHLPRRDAGPVRRFVRDLVDARRNAASYMIFIAIGFVLLSLIRTPVVRTVLSYGYPLLMLGLVIDCLILTRTVRLRVRERFPEESGRGQSLYALTRAMQVRRLRMPPAKVQVGERV